MALSEVMSLEELLCPLGGNRERMSANVRGLRGACRYGGAAPAGKSLCGGTYYQVGILEGLRELTPLRGLRFAKSTYESRLPSTVSAY